MDLPWWQRICSQKEMSLVKTPNSYPSHFLFLSETAEVCQQTCSQEPMLIKMALTFYCWLSLGPGFDEHPPPRHVCFSAQWSQDWIFISLAALFPFRVLKIVLDSFVWVGEKFLLGWRDSKLIWKVHMHVDMQHEELHHSRWLHGKDGTGEPLNVVPIGRDNSNETLWEKRLLTGTEVWESCWQQSLQ